MFRFLFALCLGLGVGYFYGWNDHEKHQDHIVKRLTERAGGAAREKVKTDADSIAASVEDAATGSKKR